MTQHDDDDTFFKSITSKEDIIERWEFEIAYYDIAVKHISHCTTGNFTAFIFSNLLECGLIENYIYL